jgi:hypothetical protein
LFPAGFVGNPFLPRQCKVGILRQLDLLLKPDDQFISTLNYRVSSCKLRQRCERQ